MEDGRNSFFNQILVLFAAQEAHATPEANTGQHSAANLSSSTILSVSLFFREWSENVPSNVEI